MLPPKITSVRALGNKKLLVGFENRTTKVFDCNPLLSFSVYQLLQEDAVFRAVRVEPGGYGISWSDEIDISEYHLWMHGTPVDLPAGDVSDEIIERLTLQQSRRMAAGLVRSEDASQEIEKITSLCQLCGQEVKFIFSARKKVLDIFAEVIQLGVRKIYVHNIFSLGRVESELIALVVLLLEEDIVLFDSVGKIRIDDDFFMYDNPAKRTLQSGNLQLKDQGE
jgi:hypothetical protein